MDDAVTAQGRKVAAHWSRLAITYEGALAALAAAGIDPSRRAETLEPAEFVSLEICLREAMARIKG